MVSAAPGPETYYGHAITFTATVTPSSGTLSGTGLVTFTDTSTGKTLFSGTPNTATDMITTNPITDLTPGIHTIQVVYSNDSNVSGSSTSINQTAPTVATDTDARAETAPVWPRSTA